MKSFITLLAVLLTNSFSAYGAQYNERNLAKLQAKYAKAVADPVPWAGYWWPYLDDGIADGENDDDGLSPADKIDAIFNRKNYATAWEKRQHGTGRRPAAWWGHCNGWAAAAIMEREPRTAVTRNGIKFSVADRKALLTEYWMESGSDFIGRRVYDENDLSSAAFWDVVPAAFHLLITNIVGDQKQSVIIDRFTGAEVWNHPLVAYEIEPIKPNDYLGPDPKYKNIYRVNVKTTIWWATDEVGANDITPEFKWKEDDFFDKRTLKYELWVDAPLKFDASGKLVSSGDIILTRNSKGGQWKNGASREALKNSHPDFIWIPLSYARSSGSKNPRINDAWVKKNLAD